MMAFSATDLLDLASTLRNPWGELRLIWRLQQQQMLEAAIILPTNRPALARAA
jgi:hypothetical protein